MRSSPIVPRFVYLPAILALITAPGCESDRSAGPGESPGNQPPAVSITAGVEEGGETAYRTAFSWSGSDPDGLVDHYLIAVDAGERVVRGDPLSWERVDVTTATFVFPATTPVPGLPGETPTALDTHTFHVKAVDDDGRESPAAARTFDAVTLTPSVVIAEIEDQGGVAWRLELDGTDPDGPAGAPAGYQYKLVDWVYSPVPGSPIAWLHSSGSRNWLIPPSMPFGMDSTDWWPPPEHLSNDTSVILQRPTHVGCCDQILAIRAVDEAGAVMPHGTFRVHTDAQAGNVVVIPHP